MTFVDDFAYPSGCFLGWLMKSVSMIPILFKKNAARKLGLSAIQKCAAAVQILGNGMTPDALDQYFRIAESTTREALKIFMKAIQGLYKSQYLKKPTRENILQQMQINERREWPGMFASINCMHYQWKNCYVAWQGHY